MPAPKLMEIIVNYQSLCGNANTVNGRPKKAYGVCCCIFFHLGHYKLLERAGEFAVMIILT